jgi:hypothetical protein
VLPPGRGAILGSFECECSLPEHMLTIRVTASQLELEPTLSSDTVETTFNRYIGAGLTLVRVVARIQ